MPRARRVTALGVCLFVAAVYIAAGPGRIDIIDGQYRFEVARNIVGDHSIQLMDPFLSDAVNGLLGAYSPYGVSGSLTGAPLVALANLVGEPSQDRQQFFFSFTSGILGAATAALLFLFLTELSVAPVRALAWTLVAAFATLAFPVATSTFDQTQHGFFILCACFFAFLSSRRDSRALAVAAGASMAFLVNYQITYVILVPAVALAALAPPASGSDEQRRGLERAVLVLFAGGAGVLVWMGINNFRFGTLLVGVQKNVRHPPVLGNPLVGLPSLLVSPGKSLFLYSPPTILALIGLVRLMRREVRLGQAIAATCVMHIGLISSLTFFGGDWCWGPRYFVAVLPLVALGFGFLDTAGRAMRVAIGATVVAGLCVQGLALSLDHHRFFYARSLSAFFWYAKPTYYFTDSALFARPGEIVESLRTGVPAEATAFRPGPYSNLQTYAVFGGWGHPDLPIPVWMRHYQVFWLPRPWPLWMRYTQAKPVTMPVAIVVVAVMALAGLGAMAAVRRDSLETPS